MKKKRKEAPSAIQQMEAAALPAIVVPFAGKEVAVIARKLTHAQIASCGEFSLIKTVQDKLFGDKKKALTDYEMKKYSEIQYNLMKLALVNPTYKEIVSMLESSIDMDKVDEKLKKLNEKVFLSEKDSEAEKLQKEILALELRYRFLLPSDFISTIITFALDSENSDIVHVSEEMLYNAAIKAKLGGDNPADHIGGTFSDFNREDINNRAWVVFNERRNNNAR